MTCWTRVSLIHTHPGTCLANKAQLTGTWERQDGINNNTTLGRTNYYQNCHNSVTLELNVTKLAHTHHMDNSISSQWFFRCQGLNVLVYIIKFRLKPQTKLNDTTFHLLHWHLRLKCASRKPNLRVNRLIYSHLDFWGVIWLVISRFIKFAKCFFRYMSKTNLKYNTANP